MSEAGHHPAPQPERRLVRGFGADHRRRSRHPRVAGNSAGDWKAIEVQSAATADEGLTRIGDRPFDLVLLDLALPDRNGMELLAELHSHDPQLAVIMITAYGTVENAVKAMQAGATNFVQKPWDNEKLLADVRAAVARHRSGRRKRPAQARPEAALQL